MKLLSQIMVLALLFLACSKTNKSEKHVQALDLDMIDHSIDPCQNFYHYATNGWTKDNPIPETESRWYAMNVLAEDNKQNLLKIVTQVAKKENVKKGSEEQMIKDAYNSGMDTLERNKKGISGIEDILTEINQADRREDIIHLFGELGPLGVRTPIAIYIRGDKKDSKSNVVYSSQSGLNLPDRDYYLSDDERFVKIREAYVGHINKMLSLCGKEAKGDDILKIETELASMSWSREENRDPDATYNKMSFTEWDHSLQNIDLNQIVETRGFNNIDSIIVAQPSFFTALDELFPTVEIQDWKNYLTWNTISSFSNYLTTELEKEHFNFYSTTLRGTAEMKPLDERIFSQVNGALGQPLGKLFVKKYFSEESKEYMKEMIENLRSAYKESINNLTWMSSDTKQKALKKLESFTYKVGYPDEWEDYSDLEIVEGDYVQNARNVRAFGYQKMLEKQDKPVDRTEWHMTPQMVNAYYNSGNNEIVFPAGILQPPFFSKDFDHAVNYGGIGAVIGHEFSHGFDDKGSKFDWDGNLNDWWTVEDREKFEALAAKLGDQYSSYSPIEGMNVNGNLTMGENIADLGGVTLAYGALQKAIEGNVPDSIDGFTWQQRFFLSWANVWKGSVKEEQLVNLIKSDPHSPAEYRVIGPLVNFKPYEEAFGVCPNTPMYKADSAKIKIW